MSLTTIKAELSEILIELEEAAAQKPRDGKRVSNLLRQARNEKFANAYAVTPELRAWLDGIVLILASPGVHYESE